MYIPSHPITKVFHPVPHLHLAPIMHLPAFGKRTDKTDQNVPQIILPLPQTHSHPYHSASPHLDSSSLSHRLLRIIIVSSS